MKVLVLQMARLGDIFQTWPTLRALHRTGAEVHVLVRPRFRAAAEGCEAIARIHEFETDKILASVVEHPIEGMRPSLEALDGLLHRLDVEKFDRIINLSFSPLSSWITFDLEMRSFQRGKAMATAGYTRHIDGTLAIPDDASAYFFAQVGYRVQTGSTESINRLSIPRLFATIAGVDPVEADWRGPAVVAPLPNDVKPPEKFVAIHVGASNESKTLNADHWGEVTARVFRRTGLPVVLLGAGSEVEKANAILKAAERHGVSAGDSGPAPNIVSLVGRTGIGDLFELVRRASVLLAGDSALVQMASLTGTRVLNVSSRTVSHWETGPASAGSRVLLYGGAAPATETIVRETELMLSDSKVGSQADRFVAGPIETIVDKTGDGYADFMWQLISAIYMGTPVPQNSDRRLQDALAQWFEIQNIENHQLNALKAGSGDARQIASILERVDELTRLVAQAEPRVAPIERWWSTEKIRLGPQPQDVLTEKYLTLNSQLESILLSLRETEGIRDGHELDI